MLAVATCFALIGALVVEVGIRHTTMHQSTATIELPSGASHAFMAQVRHAPGMAISDHRVRAVVEGIVMGRTDEIAPHDIDAFRRSGLWHLLAASGQNIALVVVLCIAFAVVVGAGRQLGMVCALVAIPAYVVLVGGGPSIVRAGLMGEIGVVAWLAARSVGIAHAVAMSAAIMVWAWPGVHRLLGFQLSFACVVALALWCEPVVEALRSWHVPRILAMPVAASIVCTLATSPLLLIRTGSAPMLGAAANIIAVPLASVVLIVGLPGAMLMLVAPPIGHVALNMCGLAAGVLLQLAHIVASAPGAATTRPVLAIGVPAWLLASWLHARCAARAPRGSLLHATPRYLTASVFTMCVLGLLHAGHPAIHTQHVPSAGQLRVSILDVGQGMAAVVQTRHHAVLVDVGPPGSLVPQMVNTLGVKRLDGVVLSHDSRDHRGNIDAVVRRWHPSWIAIPLRAQGKWARIRAMARTSLVCQGDTLLVGDNVQLRVLNPPCDHTWPSVTGDSHNDNAMVVVVEHRNIRILLPADCEAPILKRLDIGAVDAMEVSHHGSRDPELASMLDSLQPHAALISVGARNTYGHPSAQTLEALSSRSIPVARTDREGSLEMLSDGQRLRIVSGIRLA